MDNLLRSKEYWSLIENGVTVATGNATTKQHKSSNDIKLLHKLGHYHNECPNWEENSNYAEFDDGREETCLLAKADLSSCAQKEVWFLGSGCSNLMVFTKEWLFEFDDTFRDSVKHGDDSKMHVMGKGNSKLCIGGKIHINHTGVYYLSGLRNNLLSMHGTVSTKKNLIIVLKSYT